MLSIISIDVVIVNIVFSELIIKQEYLDWKIKLN